MNRRERLPHQPIINRPKLLLKNNKKIILWVIVNLEVWDPDLPQPRNILPPPMNAPMLPDLPNWSWHEYGMRVGFWRILKALQERQISSTLALNATVVNFTKEEVIGWESPGLTETADTLDILSEHGIKYTANWPVDDLPQDLKVKSGKRMITLPYPIEINDVVMTSVQVHKSDEIFTRGKLQFDRLYQEADENVKIMAISVHPYLTGVPHRISFFEQLLDYILNHQDVEIMTGKDIYNWYTKQVPK